MPRFSFWAVSVTLREVEKKRTRLQNLAVFRLGCFRTVSQCGGGEVGVLVLELAVQRQAPLVLVVGQQGRQHVHLVQGGARAQREALSGGTKRKRILVATNFFFKKTTKSDILALNFGHCALVLRGGEEADVGELPHRHLDLLDRLVGVVLDVHVHGDLLAVVIKLKNDTFFYVGIRSDFLPQQHGDTAHVSVAMYGLKKSTTNVIVYRSAFSQLTSLSSEHSRWSLLGDIMNSLLTSTEGCSPGLLGAYITLRMARRTEFLNRELGIVTGLDKTGATDL